MPPHLYIGNVPPRKQPPPAVMYSPPKTPYTPTMTRRALCSLAAAAALALPLSACDRSLTRAGLITADNFDQVAPTGSTAAAKPGDYYLRNALATFIIQQPSREVALGPYGGTLVDAALREHGDTLTDHFGELIPTFGLTRTLYVDEMQLISDGSNSHDAVLEAHGTDAANVYYNLEGIEPGLIGFNYDDGPDDQNLLELGFDPDASLNLDATIRYTLPKDEARLTILYLLTNAGTETASIPFGLFVDSRGSVEAFSPGNGFAHNLSKSLDEDELLDLLTLDDTIDQQILLNDEMAISIIPRRVAYPSGDETIEKIPPRVIGLVVPVLGAAMVLEASTALKGATEHTFILQPGETAEIEIDVLIAPTAAEALERGWELLGENLVAVDGCVTLLGGGAAANVRVGLTHAERGTIATYTTGDDGCFDGHVPAGDYTAVAGTLFRTPSNEETFTAPGSVQLSLAPMAGLRLDIDIYDQLNATDPSPHPCRVTLVGERQVTSHPALGDAPIDNPGNAVHRVYHLRTCQETIDVAPGRYLAYVTRGPEFTRVERLVDLDAANGPTVLRDSLHRVVDSGGYAACDFHVHSIYSPDSAVPAIDRVISLAAEGMDFWASTDHDVVADFQPYIDDLGLGDELLTVPGAEVTTFALGHFGAYPLDVDETMVNGGAPDWAPRLDGTRPTFGELFDAIHERGALVQVNHPRGGGMGNYFTRGGLSYAPLTLEPFANTDDQPVANTYLRYPDDVSFFSFDFDIIEVMNGISTYVENGMVYERDVEYVGHDWMNLLSNGQRIIGVANSDTHTLAKPPGNPRTMVGGHDSGVSGLFASLIYGDAVMTTGPMLRVQLIDADGNTAGLGDTLSPTDTQVTLRAHIETPDWYRVDTLEVIANVSFSAVPYPAVAPAAVPRVSLDPVLTPRPNGGAAWVAQVDVPLDLDRWPFNGVDTWIVVRVGGTQDHLYPLMFSGGGTVNTEGDSPETFFTGRWGRHPFAMTNPIFVDLDGDGKWR